MGETKNFVFYQNWRDFIKGLSSQADQLQLMTAIIDYGVTGEYDELAMSPMVRNTFNTMIKPAIDRSQKNYADSVEYGKSHGRPRTINDDRIRDLFKKGMKADAIAKELGISVTSVYHSDGWKNRKG
jgi:hypothetical protein